MNASEACLLRAGDRVRWKQGPQYRYGIVVEQVKATNGKFLMSVLIEGDDGKQLAHSWMFCAGLERDIPPEANNVPGQPL